MCIALNLERKLKYAPDELERGMYFKLDSIVVSVVE
jgi:hypothetical protein